MQTRTTESVLEAVKLCDAAKCLPQDKAAIAAMMTDAFINGMRTQQLMDSAPAQPQK